MTGVKEWNICERLSEAGPDDNVYEFDTRTGEVSFGNGVNGRIPSGRLAGTRDVFRVGRSRGLRRGAIASGMSRVSKERSESIRSRSRGAQPHREASKNASERGDARRRTTPW